ncbi:MAG TPA: SurA N-terminal domain-containing protein, partial [Planctomycetaceae bacterium]|nr:SurA N-terminal domain-containing protein [Planctomycetaceae bacterium]
MNRSPFEIFRRNQRQLMVLLTGLSMFAFVFLDAATSRSGNLPTSLGVLSVALICAGGLWVIGSPRGKGGEWAVYGAIVGAVIAFFGFRAQSNSAVYVTTVKNFSRDELAQLQARRGTANRFMYAAMGNQFFPFGGANGSTEEAIVMRSLHLAEARKLGISVSNDAVVAFIKRMTAEKLSRPDYEKILRDLHLSESELFDILKEELAINLYE